MGLFNWGKKSPDAIKAISTKTYIERDSESPFSKDVSRKRAMSYVPFARLIEVISLQAADVITDTLRVVNREKKQVDTEVSRRVCRLLMESPDGMQSAHRFIKECMADLLIEGNALVHARRGTEIGGRMPVLSLERLIADEAQAYITDHSKGMMSLVYYATPFGGEVEQTISGRDVIHVIKTPREGEGYNSYGTQFFGDSPLKHLKNALNIGISLDLFLMDYFNKASKSELVIEFPDAHDKTNMEAFKVNYESHVASGRNPLFLFGGATAKNLKSSPADADAVNLRMSQVEEIARYYGVPAPLIGLHVTQWGSGLEQLARLMWRYSTRLYAEQLLQEMSFKLLPSGNKFEVDDWSEIKGDTAALSKWIASVRPTTNNPGVLSQKEVRAKVGYFTDYDDDWEFKSTMDADNLPDHKSDDDEEMDDDDK